MKGKNQHKFHSDENTRQQTYTLGIVCGIRLRIIMVFVLHAAHGIEIEQKNTN